MANFVDRLVLFMQESGINDNQMTVAAGLAIGSIGKLRNGKTKGINSTNIEKILSSYPQLSVEWLFTGEGNMLKTSNEETMPAPDGEVAPSIIRQFLDTIKEQSIEIGMLQERIAHLTASTNEKDTVKAAV